MDKEQPGKINAAYLPLDVLADVFRFLNTKSKGKTAQVCSSWKEAANYKSVWRNVRISMRNENLNIQTEHNIIKRGIKRFDIYILEPKVHAFLRRVPDVEHLRFIGSRDNLNIVELSRSAKVDDYVLKTFTKGMKMLQVLHLDACVLNASKFLSYVEANNFAGEEVSKSLQQLYFTNFWKFQEETIDYICQKYVNLVSLTLNNCRICWNARFVHLPELEKLEILSIVHTYGITDALLRNISRLSNLKSLNISIYGGITTSVFEYISRLTNLMHLNLEGVFVIDVAIRHINKLPLLRELGLRGSVISDVGLSYLAEGNLKLLKLDISHCPRVTDQGLFNICQSTFDLHYLDVSGCEITDSGISHIIQKFRQLQVINITRCALVTDASKKLIADKLNRSNNLDYIGRD